VYSQQELHVVDYEPIVCSHHITQSFVPSYNNKSCVSALESWSKCKISSHFYYGFYEVWLTKWNIPLLGKVSLRSEYRNSIISYSLTVRTCLLHNFVAPVFKNLSRFTATETLLAMLLKEGLEVWNRFTSFERYSIIFMATGKLCWGETKAWLLSYRELKTKLRNSGYESKQFGLQ